MSKKLLAALTATLFFGSVYPNEHVYIEELNNFKNSPDYQLVFKDKQDTNGLLQLVVRDIENCKHLSQFQRLIHSTFLGLDAIVVTPSTMPKLYAFIDGICAKAEIKTPVVFLTREKGFFNAAAQKLLRGTDALVIDQKLLLEASQEALEAVICHEIGHIKHDHVAKVSAIALPTLISSFVVSYYLSEQHLEQANIVPFVKKILPYVIANHVAGFATALIPSLIINKRFEKEADEFAYKTMDKSTGLIDFFKRVQAKEQSVDKDFDYTRAMLDAHKSKLNWFDYINLSTGYYLAKCGHTINKAYMWLYHNTSFGLHPSTEARIQAVQDYVASQPQAVLAA